MTEAKSKLAKWLQDHPNDWLSVSFQAIGKQVGISSTSVDRYLPELVADRDGIMPSDVMRQREEAGFVYRGRAKADTDNIREVINDNPNAEIRDIAYLAKCTPKAVKRVMETIEQELEGSLDTDNGDEIGEIDAEIAKLQKERAMKLQGNRSKPATS